MKELLRLVELEDYAKPDALAAFGRTAPARGPRPRARRAPQGAPPRRAVWRPGCPRSPRPARWLRQLHEELKITSVFVTHDQEEALEVADQVVVMNAGRVEQVGTPEEVYHKPATPFVYQFRAA